MGTYALNLCVVQTIKTLAELGVLAVKNNVADRRKVDTPPNPRI
jgi:hypothetical protein